MYPIDFLWRAVDRYPNRTAVFGPGGNLSFRELGTQVLDRAATLTQIDPVRGGRICVGASNGMDHLIAILAVLAAGKVWVPLNPRNGDPELRRILDFVEPSLVLADAEMQNRLSGTTAALRSLESLTQQAGDVGAVVMGPRSSGGVAMDKPQAIKFTGGTTGFPKGVIQPLRAWNTNIATQIHELGLKPDDRYLVAAPLSHGTSTYLLPLLGVGGALIIPPEQAKAAALLDAADAHGATILFAPPTLIVALAEEQRRSPRLLRRLRYLVYGGAPMRAEQIRDAQSVFGPVLCTTFGQTEAPQIITFLPPAEMNGDTLTSVGRPSLLTRVAIMNKDGEPVETGQQGEIAVRGDLVMSGYLKAEDETRKTLVDGWLRTGDAGVFDERGYLFLRDRIRDVIITGGFNVYPSDVEAVLSAHPAVADCSVVGVPDAKWGEAVHAAVQLRSGMQVDTADLVALVRRELGPVKTPRHVHLFESLPRSAVGKVLKTEVRNTILNRRGQ
ncbi:AMP-binding enzyme family protein [Paraburkholderia xenovorans LB400]|uniref:AMP-dependent synthetase and ligase n=1 Tax=Paraburkholderia xenovorans (strain LB400) TaxID=266265 RepID=Q13GC9_PARXL|nr:AMP-binding protein [Paraburkholderia xenovorans]ABE36860.1 Putative AMP-dependent synthetase and ligase [Paraburkholderia xenovorans LB400]AIP34261.1 AMP-binding enzyme family protein [Paraburkholderia xenovorans LB400]